MRWRKHAVGYCAHPKVCAAGPNGAIVFLAVLDLNAELQRDGVLLARDVEPRILASRCPLLSPSRVRAGLDACLQAGLLLRTEEGGLQVAGWDDFWRPRGTEALDGGPRKCSRCATPAEPGRSLCAGHLEADRERAREARRARGASAVRPQWTSAGKAPENPHRVRTASTVDVRSESTEDVRTPSALRPQFQNGTRYQSGCSEEERREDQSRQEVGKEGRKDRLSLSENQNGGNASGTQDTHARGAHAILARLAERVRSEERS